ncbi:dihydrofolate reductase [Microlunatus flavus]|uniref:Dihydrofolate reductase n=1 Tax=Microlunatus flavus TaxID=1036181 RepID=A0A1H9CPA0_9ACTN|nr:dihydrofolate reductase [Microlunatus flavus]SEQ03040.1 dihydrofolate reductase [Microlunatus flavus]
MSPRLVGVAAVARNGVIGADGDIPWRIPADWRRFKALTTGHTLVMGRKTFDSIGRPLPGRTTVVVTRDRRWRGDGVLVAPTIDEALDLARQREPEVVWVAGGGEVYAATWDRLDGLELTEVELEPEGAVRLPAVDPQVWRESARESVGATGDVPAYAFVSYVRRA